MRVPLAFRLCAALSLTAPAWVGNGATHGESPPIKPVVERDAYGAIVRGDAMARRLALVFTGDEFGEGAGAILDALKDRRLKASFFVTGNFLRDPKLRPEVERMVAEGHYVGPHSDGHLLYCDWNQRDKSLVTQAEFVADLETNLAALHGLGALPRDAPVYFIPPYEWYNREQVDWARKLGVELANFTPGTGSNRDYAREGDVHFVPSQKIYDDIIAYEQANPDGLNGFLLLLHLGSGRQDPFHPRLGEMCDQLAAWGYHFVRIDDLCRTAPAITAQIRAIRPSGLPRRRRPRRQRGKSCRRPPGPARSSCRSATSWAYSQTSPPRPSCSTASATRALKDSGRR